MISRKIIDSLYKRYNKPPKSIDMLNLVLLFDYAAEHHKVYIDPDTEELIIPSVSPESPFNKIAIKRINDIVPFEEWVAIVLPAAIIFLNRKSNEVVVDLKLTGPSFLDRLRGISAK